MNVSRLVGTAISTCTILYILYHRQQKIEALETSIEELQKQAIFQNNANHALTSKIDGLVERISEQASVLSGFSDTFHEVSSRMLEAAKTEGGN